MELYNSLSGKKEVFKPVIDGEISLYVCGPTVYDYIHIGNARPVIFFDVVRRYFEYLGYKVTYVSNITDVDDKIINRAIKENKTEMEITKKYIDAFWDDVLRSGSKKPHITPHATNYVSDMINFIQKLINTNHAYVSNGDVYFRVGSIENYGILSKQKTEDLEVGARINEHEKKESPLDFTLWKKTDVGIKWPSPWGDGRPGWHTECVVMIDSIFGHKIDIHGGGVDIKFPHHENEIAQCEAIHNHTIANFFMHVGRVLFDNEKMSKSIGNVVWMKDYSKEHYPLAYRLLLLSSNYKQPVSYSDNLAKQFDREYEKIERTYKNAFTILDLNDCFTNIPDKEIMKEFEKNMNDDFNTPNVITLIFSVIKKINSLIRENKDFSALFQSLKIMLQTLGIEINVAKLSDTDKEIYRRWIKARNDKNYQEADQLRSILVEKKII